MNVSETTFDEGLWPERIAHFYLGRVLSQHVFRSCQRVCQKHDCVVPYTDHSVFLWTQADSGTCTCFSVRPPRTSTSADTACTSRTRLRRQEHGVDLMQTKQPKACTQGANNTLQAMGGPSGFGFNHSKNSPKLPTAQMLNILTCCASYSHVVFGAPALHVGVVIPYVLTLPEEVRLVVNDTGASVQTVIQVSAVPHCNENCV